MGNLVYFVLLSWMVWVMGMKVKDAESMMGRVFGKEWEAYHARAKGFIPCSL